MESIFKCIIVENDAHRKCLKDTVERFGFIAFYADSEASALRIIKKEKIDLIFMDTMMAELDGIKLTEKIRNSGHEYANVPIVAVTCESENEDQKEWFEAGMNDSVVKPYGAYEVAEVIGRFCHLHNAL